MVKAGQVIANRYLLQSPIGEGAMGAVWRAEDQTLKRQIAIKFLFVKGTRDPQAMVDQFLREARIAASVQHRNVIQTVDFGTVDEYQPFMVMELLNGESLGDRFAREPKLSCEQVIHIVSLTLRGLSAVHDAGIVHRDLKPQNIFLQRDAEAVYPKILDFGISRSVDQTGERRSAIATQEGLIVGTPDYMSPEQARGEPSIDKRADIYSMGVILYQGLTGRLPFEAETIGDLIVQIVTREPPPIREIAPDVPAPIAEMVAQAMSKQREHRFADARAMRRALLAAAERVLPGGRGGIAASVPPHEIAAGSPFGAGPAPALRGPTAPALAPLFVPTAAAAPPVFGAETAPADGAARAMTWGDIEALDAPQVLDTEPLLSDRGLASALPKPQRIVARVSDPLGAQQVPRAVDGAAAAAVPGPKPRKSSRKLPGPTGGEALDPLYTGTDRAALDIDYDRVRATSRRSQTQLTPVRRSQTTRRMKPLVRTKSRLRPYLLPIVALAALWYAWTLPPLETGRGETSLPSLGGASAALEPAASGPGAAAAAAPGVGPAGGGAAERGSATRLVTKGRRSNPGNAPPHLRDVVF